MSWPSHLGVDQVARQLQRFSTMSKAVRHCCELTCLQSWLNLIVRYYVAQLQSLSESDCAAHCLVDWFRVAD